MSGSAVSWQGENGRPGESRVADDGQHRPVVRRVGRIVEQAHTRRGEHRGTSCSTTSGRRPSLTLGIVSMIGMASFYHGREARGRAIIGRPAPRDERDLTIRMTDALRSDRPSNPDHPDRDRDARIEELLLTGLDHYFAGRQRSRHQHLDAGTVPRSSPRQSSCVYRAGRGSARGETA